MKSTPVRFTRLRGEASGSGFIDFFKLTGEVMLKNALTLMIATTALFGCATPYTPPTSGPTAKLTLSTASKTASTDNYFIAIAPKNADGCGELAKPIRPDSYAKDMTVTIAGDRDILFEVGRSWGQVFCANIFSQFHAKKDYEYILNLDIVGRMCLISIIEKSPNDVLTPIKPTRAYTSSMGAITGGPVLCESKDKITGPAM
jgi:hypothetical protein